MARYAAATAVSSADSRAEIERTLTRYGADSFLSGYSGTQAQIAFRLNGRHVRFRLTLPNRDDFLYTPERNLRRTPTSQAEAWEQACRQRWRALALVVKAKLEAIEAGISTFDDEFLSHIMMPNGETVGEWVGEHVKEAYKSGRMPTSLPSIDLPNLLTNTGGS